MNEENLIAKEFAKWLYTNRWFYYDPKTDKWRQTLEHPTAMAQSTYNKYYVKTTDQLFDVFKSDFFMRSQ